jgi:hypothetical protein
MTDLVLQFARKSSSTPNQVTGAHMFDKGQASVARKRVSYSTEFGTVKSETVGLGHAGRGHQLEAYTIQQFCRRPGRTSKKDSRL